MLEDVVPVVDVESVVDDDEPVVDELEPVVDEDEAEDFTAFALLFA